MEATVAARTSGNGTRKRGGTPATWAFAGYATNVRHNRAGRESGACRSNAILIPEGRGDRGNRPVTLGSFSQLKPRPEPPRNLPWSATSDARSDIHQVGTYSYLTIPVFIESCE